MPTPAEARIYDLADAVTASLAASWSPSAPDGVEASTVARLSFDENDAVTLHTGRRLYVMPADPRLSPLTRQYWKNGYTVGVLFCERYTGAADPPEAWIRERVKWWEQTVFYPLSNPALVLAGPAEVVTQAVPDPETPPEVTTFVDRDLLVECKALLIAANFSFIDAADHTGA